MGELTRDKPEPTPEPERVRTLADGMDQFARVFERIVKRVMRVSLRDLLVLTAASGTVALAMGDRGGDPASFELAAYWSSGSLALLSCNWRRFGRWQMAAPRTPQPQYKPGGVIAPVTPPRYEPVDAVTPRSRPLCMRCRSIVHRTEDCSVTRVHRAALAKQAREDVSRLTGVSPDAPGYYATRSPSGRKP